MRGTRREWVNGDATMRDAVEQPERSNTPPDGGDNERHGDGLSSIKLAVVQTDNVKQKLETCALDLHSSNTLVKAAIAEGGSGSPPWARQSLESNEKAQLDVQECADDVHEVARTLTNGIGEMADQTRIALLETREALARSRADLENAQEGEISARLLALHDPLTGLANRILFDDRLMQAIAVAKRHERTLAVMFLDLDRFKYINDTRGHDVGDRVLTELATRLTQHTRDEDTVCRNGGDEFLFLLMNPQGRENIGRIAGFLANSIAQPIDPGGLPLTIRVSIGIAVYPEHGTTAEQLIKNADAAMYRAKTNSVGWVISSASEGE